MGWRRTTQRRPATRGTFEQDQSYAIETTGRKGVNTVVRELLLLSSLTAWAQVGFSGDTVKAKSPLGPRATVEQSGDNVSVARCRTERRSTTGCGRRFASASWRVNGSYSSAHLNAYRQESGCLLIPITPTGSLLTRRFLSFNRQMEDTHKNKDAIERGFT